MYMISAAMTKTWRPPVDWYSRTVCRSLASWNAPTAPAEVVKGLKDLQAFLPAGPLQSPLTKKGRCNPTYSRSLQQERNDAEEVDVSVINCELHKDRSGVAVYPFVPEEMLKGSGNDQ